MALLEIRNLSLRFGGLKALTDFNVALGPGDLIGLIGPNGAGKTTTFNIITGVYKPNHGDVLLNGRSIAGKKPYQINRLGIARTFQNIRLFGGLNVLDNVLVSYNQSALPGLAGTLLRTPGHEKLERRRESQAMDLLQTFGLAQRADELSSSLPYGDQRRLEIARALATGPTILLLDEPAAGMNPQEKVQLMELISFIRKKFAVGILLIEHDMKLVMSICEKITVLDHGETIAIGPPDQIQCNPKVIEAYLGESQ